MCTCFSKNIAVITFLNSKKYANILPGSMVPTNPESRWSKHAESGGERSERWNESEFHEILSRERYEDGTIKNVRSLPSIFEQSDTCVFG